MKFDDKIVLSNESESYFSGAFPNHNYYVLKEEGLNDIDFLLKYVNLQEKIVISIEERSILDKFIPFFGFIKEPYIKRKKNKSIVIRVKTNLSKYIPLSVKRGCVIEKI